MCSQFHRHLSATALIALLRKILTRVRHLRYDSWVSFPPPMDEFAEQFVVSASTECLRMYEIMLESLHMYEIMPRCLRGQPGMIHTCSKVFKKLIDSSPGLKQLSLTFLVEASEFFAGIPAGPFSTFSELQVVALTSKDSLRLGETLVFRKPLPIPLLKAAAEAAMRMPKLQVMEIWNCGEGHAAIFRYDSTFQSGTTACVLTWRCSWDCPADISKQEDNEHPHT